MTRQLDIFSILINAIFFMRFVTQNLTGVSQVAFGFFYGSVHYSFLMVVDEPNILQITGISTYQFIPVGVSRCG